jgi:tRNA (cytidine56-2'-O)-methyltransferase
MSIVVLRLGHRPLRDKRVTTHVGLVARAFGAEGILLTVLDETVLDSLDDVRDRWGGDFFVKTVSDWRKYLDKWRGLVVHLTMYGLPLDDKISEIRSLKENMLLVVGAEKVPPDLYKRADYNIAVGNQPHSEVAALAVFLDRYFQKAELAKDFMGDMRIVPSERRKLFG